jgi:hypothetical protein
VKHHLGLEICLGKNSHQLSREQEKEAIVIDWLNVMIGSMVPIK